MMKFPATTTLTLTKQVSAQPREVYDVWLDPTSPGGPWFGTAKSIVQPHVDGLFYSHVEFEGQRFPHYGRFITLDPGAKIEHTWVSPATKGLESVLTLTLTGKNGGTEVVLTHAGVPDDDMGRQHADGWNWVLQCIADRFAGTLVLPPHLANAAANRT